MPESDIAPESLLGYPELLGWQRRLYRDWLTQGHVPASLDVPTGLGKTAVMALWYAAWQGGAALPRRLIYVVDRRAVVDQASALAERIAEAAGEGLRVSVLRGGRAQDRAWLDDPAAPAIIVGTVDMIGSRLLFQGYGVGRGERAYQAGLLGADAWVVLDEAHLCTPFGRMLGTMADTPAWRGDAPVPGFRTTALSATPPGAESARARFAFDPEGDTDSVTAERLHADKDLALEEIGDASALAETLAARAWELGRRRGGRLLVYANSRATADSVHKQLRRWLAKARQEDAELFVGARRGWEREEARTRLDKLGFLGSTGPADGHPRFVVATAAGEVGVDMSADHMVCDLVAAERMIQRLGRVNRRDTAGHVAEVQVIAAPRDKKESAADARARIDTLAAPWHALPAGSAAGTHAASPAAIRRLQAEQPGLVALASSAEPLYPVLTRPEIEAWSLTSLRSHPGRAQPGPWLRGWVDEPPQTSVAWRLWLPWPRELDSRPERGPVERFFHYAGPAQPEMLETETVRVAEVLGKRAQALWDSDDNGRLPAFILLNQAKEFQAAWTVAEVAKASKRRLENELAGRIAVVWAPLGGLTQAGLLDEKAPGPAIPYEGYSHRSDADKHASEHALKTLDGGEGAGSRQDELGVRVVAPGENLAGDPWRVVYRFFRDEEQTVDNALAVEVKRDPGQVSVGDPAVQRRHVRLEDHHASVRAAAEELADALGLAPAERAMLAAAAAIHDRGKARPLWQRAMNAPTDGALYAKTRGGGQPERLMIAGDSYRHEMGTLADIAHGKAALEGVTDPELHELGLHLIAAHHGHARPALAAQDPGYPPDRVRPVAEDAALRFARLQARWGPWGLAWWEAVFRAADRRGSARDPAAPEPASATGEAA